MSALVKLPHLTQQLQLEPLCVEIYGYPLSTVVIHPVFIEARTVNLNEDIRVTISSTFFENSIDFCQSSWDVILVLICNFAWEVGHFQAIIIAFSPHLPPALGQDNNRRILLATSYIHSNYKVRDHVH